MCQLDSCYKCQLCLGGINALKLFGTKPSDSFISNISVINAKLSVDSEHNCDQKPEDSCFSKLKLVYFFLVQYVTETRDPGSRPGPEPFRNQNFVSSQNQNFGNRSSTTTPSMTTTGLHCVLRHAKNLEAIQATGSPRFGDRCLENILSRNPLKKLRRFILTDASSTNDENVTTVTNATQG